MPRKKRYLLRDSDRDGFTYRDIEMVTDNGFVVGPGEFDNPPPSNRLYAGEGDISPGDTRVNYNSYTTPPELQRITQVISANQSINVNWQQDNSNFKQNDSIGAYLFLAGSSSLTALSSNPQIPSGMHGDKIFIQCVSNNLVIRNGNGLKLYTPIFNMNSGSQINMIYNATDSLWHETSRGNVSGLIGVF